MQSVLNFSQAEKKGLTAFLAKFEALETKSAFEESRARIDSCVVTLYKSGKLLVQGNGAEAVKQKILAEFQGESELVLGIDEAGRGENFGPLVVAGVLGETSELRELRDSKKTRAIGEKALLVGKNALETKIVEISALEIDELRFAGKNLNEIEAGAINGIIAFFEKKFSGKKFRIIIDGNRIKGVQGKKAEFLPKADDKIVQVAAASVLAKNARNKSSDKVGRKTWKARKS